MGKRIVVADRSAPMRRNLVALLAAEGHECLAAGDGLEALSLAIYERPQLLLVDPEIDRINGVDLCRALRANSATALLPVVFMSQHELDRSLQPALDAGAVDCLLKPVDAKLLLSRISRYVGDAFLANQSVTLKSEGCPVVYQCQIKEVDGARLVLAIPLLTQECRGFFSPGGEAEIEFPTIFGLSRCAVVVGAKVVCDTPVLEVFLASAAYRGRRRLTYRKTVNLPVRYRTSGSFFRLGTLLDVSGMGLRIGGCHAAVGVGDELQVEFNLPTGHIAVAGRVIWRALGSGAEGQVGVQIVQEEDVAWRLKLTGFLFQDVISRDACYLPASS